MATKTKTAPKTAAIDNAKREEILTKAAPAKDQSKVAQKMTELQVAVTNDLAAMQSRMIALGGQLTNVEQAIEIRKKELEALHGVDLAATEISTLEDQIAMTKAEWSRQQSERKAKWEAEEQEWDKEHARKEEEWEYSFTQATRKREDALNDQLAQRNKVFTADLEQRSKAIAERQQAVTAAEQELKDLRIRVAGIEKEISSAVSKATAQLEASLKRHNDYELGRVNTQLDTEKRLANQQVLAAQAETARTKETLAQANATIASLQANLKEVSTSAFSAMSGQAALKAVQETQASTNPAAGSKNAR